MARSSKPKAAAPRGARTAKRGPAKPRKPPHYFDASRVIRRYGNRRLYDPTLKRSITMEEIAAAVARDEPLRIVDAATGEEITKRVLVQIILEEQNSARLEMLPLDFLRKLITMRSDSIGPFVEQYLNAGAEWLSRQTNSASTQSIQSSYESFFPWLKSRPPVPPAEKRTHAEPVTPAAGVEDEVAALRRQVSELKRRVTNDENGASRKKPARKRPS